MLLLCPFSSAAADAETRHVLVLSSSERPHAIQSGFANSLIRELTRSSREPIQFVEIALQSARESGELPDVSAAQRIRSAFEAGQLDLVITIGGPAATFAQQFRRDLFPDTPMLIAGVDRRFVDDGTFTDNETIVATQHDPASVIDEIVRLVPETRSVMVVIGNSQLEQFWLKAMQRAFARFGDRLQFSYTNGLSFEEIKERCRTMPPRSAIFYALLSLDGKGEPRVEGETLSELHAAANAPLFALYGMGRGAIGGPMLSTEEVSRKAAAVALRVLAGESPGSIKTPVQRTGTPTYDARELRRWNIDESRLPSGSVVRFREPTTWERNRVPVTLGALAGGIPAAAIAVFVTVRRRRAHDRRPAENAILTPVPDDDATVRMWTADADGRRVDIGQRRDGATRDSWTAAIHPEDVERCRGIYSRALQSREPFQMEYRLREGSGAERFILDTGIARFSGSTFDGFLGSAVDITKLGRARAELSDLSRHLLQVYEQDQAALAKTLHEDVCQRMVALTLRLHGLQGAAHDAEVADIREKLTTLVGEIAAVSDPVHRQVELQGLSGAARRFCDDLAARSGVVIHFHDEDVPRELPSDVALAMFRALQEATVNAVVHSKAREVWVSVSGTAAKVHLHVVDRGIGFDTQRGFAGGVGLVAIRERLKLVNGDTLIVSSPGKGTRVEAWAPVPQGPLAV